jgi:hypothetical protein
MPVLFNAVSGMEQNYPKCNNVASSNCNIVAKRGFALSDGYMAGWLNSYMVINSTIQPYNHPAIQP